MSSTETPPKTRWSFGKKIFVGMAVASLLVMVAMVGFVVWVTQASTDQQNARYSDQPAATQSVSQQDDSLNETNSDAGSRGGGTASGPVQQAQTPEQELQAYLDEHLPTTATKADHFKWPVEWYCNKVQAGEDSLDVRFAAGAAYEKYRERGDQIFSNAVYARCQVHVY